MEHTYDVRGETISLDEDEGILAVRLDDDSRTIDDLDDRIDALDLGTPVDSAVGVRQQDPFEAAGWVFVHPSERVNRSADANDPPEGTEAVGRVYRDADGRALIDTHHLTCKLDPELDEDAAMETLAELEVSHVRTLGFARNLFEVRPLEGEATLEAASRLTSHPAVEYAEPSFVEHIESREAEALTTREAVEPNDPRYDEQWRYPIIDAPEAWAETRGESATIAVIDNGFDVDHEDLADAVSEATAHYTDGAGDSGEFVLDAAGYPKRQHGTMCAGMAAAVGDNATGVCGSAWEAPLSLVACLQDQVGSQTTLARAVGYAADPSTESAAASAGLGSDDGADVIVCSLGPSTGANWVMHSVLKEAIDGAVERGRDELGAPVFWAVSNGNVTIDGEDGTDQVSAYERTIAVGRSNEDDEPDGSAYGPKLDFLAPGAGVLTTGNDDGYRIGTGTSFAAPCAAGVAALVLDVNPGLSWEDVCWTMIDACDDVGGGPDHHANYGFGRINAAESIHLAMQSTVSTRPSMTGPDAAAPDAPPTFAIDRAGYTHFQVELATRADLFDSAGHGDERASSNFYPVYGEESVTRETGTEYAPPAAVWERLTDGAERIYYRVFTAMTETGWEIWDASLYDAEAGEAPSIELAGTRSATGPPSIEGPDETAVTGGVPTFRVDAASYPYYQVELATRAHLFDSGARYERRPSNFYPLYGDDRVERSTDPEYAPPIDVWHRLVDSGADRIYYRIFAARGETGWEAWDVSTDDSEYESAPSIALVGDRPEAGGGRADDHSSGDREGGLDARDDGAFLHASVGAGGENRPDDVRALRNRFVDLGYDWLDITERVDDELRDVINLVQSITAGRHRVRGDGRVDVPGPTYAWLTSENPPRWRRMPVGSKTGDEGFYNYEIAEQHDDDHEFGTDWLAATLESAGTRYQQAYRASAARAAPITVNDASRPRGGRTSDHSGHQTGLSVDLRLPREDGTAPGATTHRHDRYDRDAMRAMLEAFAAEASFERAFFNDPALIAEGLCTRLSNHDDHAHVEIHPPERRGGTREALPSVERESRA